MSLEDSFECRKIKLQYLNGLFGNLEDDISEIGSIVVGVSFIDGSFDTTYIGNLAECYGLSKLVELTLSMDLKAMRNGK